MVLDTTLEVVMPWFPDFVGAAELVRVQTRAGGRADPVGRYLLALDRGDTHALEDVWPGEVVVHDPRSGEVRGHRELRRFVRRSKSFLADHDAQVETLASTVGPGRAVVELVAHLAADGRRIAWPVAVAAESFDDRSVVFRSYLSLGAIDGVHHVRPPLLGPGRDGPGDVVGRYAAAVAAGDVDAAVGAFAPDGYYREPADQQATHRGGAELRAFFDAQLAGGGIDVEHCTVTDDGVRCAVEYNVLHRGGREVPPQAGLAVHERDGSGRLAAVRVYDDVETPVVSPQPAVR